MGYYSPVIIGILGFFVSVLNSACFPIFGYLLSKILFVMMNPKSPTFIDDRNFWCGMFLILAFCIAIFGSLQKVLFSYVGENLTY
jgi:hypothetical protein